MTATHVLLALVALVVAGWGALVWWRWRRAMESATRRIDRQGVMLVDLLVEGVELLREGVELLREIAERHRPD